MLLSKIAFIEKKEMKLNEDVQNNLPLIKEGLEMKTGNWIFNVLKYFYTFAGPNSRSTNLELGALGINPEQSPGSLTDLYP